jgi:hypothetical protein
MHCNNFVHGRREGQSGTTVASLVTATLVWTVLACQIGKVKQSWAGWRRSGGQNDGSRGSETTKVMALRAPRTRPWRVEQRRQTGVARRAKACARASRCGYRLGSRCPRHSLRAFVVRLARPSDGACGCSVTRIKRRFFAVAPCSGAERIVPMEAQSKTIKRCTI